MVFIDNLGILFCTIRDDCIAVWILAAQLLLIYSSCNVIIPSTLEIMCVWNSIRVLLTVSLLITFICVFWSSIVSDICLLLSFTILTNPSFQFGISWVKSTVDWVTNKLLSELYFLFNDLFDWLDEWSFALVLKSVVSYLRLTDSNRYFTSAILKIYIEDRRTAHVEIYLIIVGISWQCILVILLWLVPLSRVIKLPIKQLNFAMQFDDPSKFFASPVVVVMLFENWTSLTILSSSSCRKTFTFFVTLFKTMWTCG